jgi:hypothetical protein
LLGGNIIADKVIAYSYEEMRRREATILYLCCTEDEEE